MQKAKSFSKTFTFSYTYSFSKTFTFSHSYTYTYSFSQTFTFSTAFSYTKSNQAHIIKRLNSLIKKDYSEVTATNQQAQKKSTNKQ